jgi:hypothetical protein
MERGALRALLIRRDIGGVRPFENKSQLADRICDAGGIAN